LLDHRRHRKEHLRKHYYFDCACERCGGGDVDDPADPERSMFCVSCASCGDAVHVGCEKEQSTDPCDGCGHKIDDAALDKYAETFEIVAEKVNALQFSLDVAEFCFKQMTKERIARNVSSIFFPHKNFASNTK
jgi:hypothetical protein